MLSGHRLSDLAQTYSEEALDCIVQIARGMMKAHEAYPVITPKSNHGKRRLPKDLSKLSAEERNIELSIQRELVPLTFIRWNVRLAAWIDFSAAVSRSATLRTTSCLACGFAMVSDFRARA